MQNATIIHKLERISDDYRQSDLKRYVAKSILSKSDGYEKIENWFNDLLSHGCSSGMIGELIYYTDTHEFYDEFYSDIEDLRYETEQSTGLKLAPDGDLKNWFAWFAYKQTVYKIGNEIGIIQSLRKNEMKTIKGTINLHILENTLTIKGYQFVITDWKGLVLGKFEHELGYLKVHSMLKTLNTTQKAELIEYADAYLQEVL